MVSPRQVLSLRPFTQHAARWWSRVGILIASALIILAAATRLWDPLPVETLRLKTFDFYNRLLPRPRLENSPVVIVNIDEKSLVEFGQWPWPRTRVARLLASLRDAGAAVAGFDIVFAEEDRTSPDAIANSLPGLNAPVRENLLSLPSNDERLARIMKTFRTVLGQAAGKDDTGDLPDDAASATSVKGIRTLGPAGKEPSDFLFSHPSLIGNIPVLEENALGRGIFSVADEVDGVVRRVPVITDVAGVLKPALTLEMLRVAFAGNSIFLTMDQAGLVDVGLQTPRGDFRVPVDEKGRVWVYFSEPDNLSKDNSHFYISAADILNKEVPPERLAGKLVLIGTSAAGLLDIRATPISARLPGVEVHANLLETILTQNFIQYPPEIRVLELAMIIIQGAIMILLIPRIGPVWTLAGLLLLGGSLIGTSWYLFEEYKILVDVTYPGIVVAILFAVLTFTNYARDAVEKRQVRSAFSQYLSPDVVEQLARHPEQLKLGGETRYMTSLFCDVRGFTTISEQFKQDPQGLTSLLNQLLTPLTEAILRRNGTIDKYMGDCVMAFWNAPLLDPDQEAHACQAALEMLRQLDQVNETRSDAEPLKIGIGINSGECVVGNMGSDQRFDYSVIGDAVNLASRLEGQSKTYGVDIIVGPDTAAAVTDKFALAELDMIAVKGKSEAVKIYALIGNFNSITHEHFQEFTKEHSEFLSAYRGQNWASAKEHLQNCRQHLSGRLNAYYDLMTERISLFETTPPPSNWNGVFEATSK